MLNVTWELSEPLLLAQTALVTASSKLAAAASARARETTQKR